MELDILLSIVLIFVVVKGYFMDFLYTETINNTDLVSPPVSCRDGPVCVAFDFVINKYGPELTVLSRCGHQNLTKEMSYNDETEPRKWEHRNFTLSDCGDDDVQVVFRGEAPPYSYNGLAVDNVHIGDCVDQPPNSPTAPTRNVTCATTALSPTTESVNTAPVTFTEATGESTSTAVVPTSHTTEEDVSSVTTQSSATSNSSDEPSRVQSTVTTHSGVSEESSSNPTRSGQSVTSGKPTSTSQPVTSGETTWSSQSVTSHTSSASTAGQSSFLSSSSLSTMLTSAETLAPVSNSSSPSSLTDSTVSLSPSNNTSPVTGQTPGDEKSRRIYLIVGCTLGSLIMVVLVVVLAVKHCPRRSRSDSLSGFISMDGDVPGKHFEEW
ncbi:hypothetical protein BaRGS_00005082 [Batillaria attramentaria]|uniref:MAM domain-containing protein n=1 Tax=Batillaria attramentaria TaxID=370345 RepID=A0ABD0LVV4_9CAEN